MFSPAIHCRDTAVYTKQRLDGFKPDEPYLFISVYYLILSELFPCEGEVPRRGDGVLSIKNEE